MSDAYLHRPASAPNHRTSSASSRMEYTPVLHDRNHPAFVRCAVVLFEFAREGIVLVMGEGFLRLIKFIKPPRGCKSQATGSVVHNAASVVLSYLFSPPSSVPIQRMPSASSMTVWMPLLERPPGSLVKNWTP